MCLYPKLIKNPKYKQNKKNGGVIPSISDPRVLYVPIGCGNCMECRKKKAREWQVRLTEDIKTNTNGKFITLTFNNESIKKLICENEELQKLTGYDLDNAIATKAVRLWLERWRKKFGKSLRHWLVSELGHNGTENIHLHGIIWTNTQEVIETTWQYGYVWTGKGSKKENYVNNKTVNYIIKYVTKIDEKHKYYKSIILTSPGIGANYNKTLNATKNKFNENNTNETYKTQSGHKLSLPIYYRNKLYTEDEKEKLWLHRLDKNERYVGGEKITATNTEEYYRLLEYYRKLNNQLGYGNDKINWDEKTYEETRRQLLTNIRINNAKQIQSNKKGNDNNNNNNNNN